jgi:hypothetical protein
MGSQDSGSGFFTAIAIQHFSCCLVATDNVRVSRGPLNTNDSTVTTRAQ